MPARRRAPDVVFEPVMRSAAIKKVDQVLRAVAGKEITLTLVGESGTGKEVLARRAHELSERRTGPFIPINCAAIPDALFESELFGHEKGAFTGASERVRGKVDAAERGTLFLDEIGEMPLAMQAKLLRFIEHRRYMRVGGNTKIEADIRLMCATLRPLEAEVRAERFRADLFYRIQGITLHVPALRHRRADVLPLLEHFVLQLAGKHGVRAPRFTREAKAALLAHSWPGNIRELRNVVETLCLLRPGKAVRAADLPEEIRASLPAMRKEERRAPSTSLSLDLDDGLEALIEQIVDAALALEQGSKLKAAERLRISPRTVQRYVAAGRVKGLARKG